MTETIYLAHNFYDRKSVRRWELKMEKRFNIKLDNPFYDNDRNDIKALDNLTDHSPEQQKYFMERNTPEMCRDIVEGDLKMIRKADGLVALIKSTSLGTSMEIIMAARVYSIPVYIITTNYGFHPWVRYLAAKVFKSRKEFEKFVKEEFGLKKKGDTLDDLWDNKCDERWNKY